MAIPEASDKFIKKIAFLKVYSSSMNFSVEDCPFLVSKTPLGFPWILQTLLFKYVSNSYSALGTVLVPVGLCSCSSFKQLSSLHFSLFSS